MGLRNPGTGLRGDGSGVKYKLEGVRLWLQNSRKSPAWWCAWISSAGKRVRSGPETGKSLELAGQSA